MGSWLRSRDQVGNFAMKYFLTIGALVLLSSYLGKSKLIDLQNDLVPAEVAPVVKDRFIFDSNRLILELARENERKLPRDSDRKPVGSKTPVVGSNITVYKDYRNDKGFFSTIFQAYKNHWVLKTTPEDWWFTIIRQVALAVDKHADKQKVRDFFVSHEGKKELVVNLGHSVYTSNYSSFLDQMTSKIGENLNNPEYVNAISSDFDTSTPTHKIVANIAIMSSVQDFFAYTGSILCGIPRVDMQGEEQDWKQLKNKVVALKEYLEPIVDIMGQRKWWPKLENVTQKLLETYQGNPDLLWWNNIVRRVGSGGCGGPQTYDGWFVTDFLNEQPDNLHSGLISVPMKIKEGDVEEQSALVAGIPGYLLEERYNGTDDIAVQAVHAWALMLEENSVFRNELIERDSNNEIF